MKILSTNLNKIKSRSLVELECEQCHESFYTAKRIVIRKRTGDNHLRCCSKSCLCLLLGETIECTCYQCGIIIKKSRTKFNKSERHFCSSSCSAKISNKNRTKIWTPEKRKKQSDWAKSNAYDISKFNIRKSEVRLQQQKIPYKREKKQLFVEKTCPQCSNIFTVAAKYKKKKYCSLTCSYQNPNLGGYRKNSGRGKMGWYMGYFCQSSWELAWVIYSLDHNIKFTRNTVGFPYIVDGKNKKYFPDFILEDGSYLEIKGWGYNTVEKISQFPHKIQVLYKGDMKPYLDYVISKYGKDFIKMYSE